ncbi:permease [Quadrisphaera sp. DSM 44207]|uniref:permease n=1 Tax=Quadrisphaera sp. DSM 44207 TaxID=1881057 RepID=UPI00088D4F10|nr:permease [Quadrisphaera sp. DSM 44207]SDQ63378.1 hypothetical protein SAMN05428996_2171 [Quadrisphaera sp. DSM 44207]
MSAQPFDRDRSTGAVPATPAPAEREVLPPPVVRETERVERVEPVVRPAAPPVGTRDEPVNVAVEAQRRDRVRWGPVWAGLIVALPTFLLLELVFLALGWLDLGVGAGGTNAGWVSGLLGLLAFFLGGLTAGATAMWRGADDGLLHGILVWALGVVAFLFLTLLGGGALFGSLAGAVTQVVDLQQLNAPDIDPAQAVATARSAASFAVLGLGLAVIASALGGLLGARTWPRKEDVEPDAVTVR